METTQADRPIRRPPMIKLPVKDRDTIPWMTQREIPAIKAALSAWRKLRRDRAEVAEVKNEVMQDSAPELFSWTVAEVCTLELEKLAAIDERLRKETPNGKQS